MEVKSLKDISFANNPFISEVSHQKQTFHLVLALSWQPLLLWNHLMVSVFSGVIPQKPSNTEEVSV